MRKGRKPMKLEKVLFIPGDQVTVGISSKGYPCFVFVPHPDLAMGPGIEGIGAEFSVEQARGIAATLLRMADEVEKRHSDPTGSLPH
jgi:hypothetical protein